MQYAIRSSRVTLKPSMEFFAEGSPAAEISDAQSAERISQLLSALKNRSPLKRVLLLPPDYTRFHSGAGPLTCQLFEQLTHIHGAHVEILPATGTHFAMSDLELDSMFPGIPRDRFHVHNFRTSVEDLGTIGEDVLERLSEGKLRCTAKVQLNRLVRGGNWDAVISVGQLVPHEVIGIANQIKNILVGAGGSDMINKSHWLGAVYGMERIMGQPRTPVRALLDHAARSFLGGLPIVYLLTVRARNAAGRLVTRGLFAGDDEQCFLTGSTLCREVNLDCVSHAPRKVVVFLDPDEFKSTWLGNKSVYRSRMAIADDGELVVLAPGVRQFGEDPAIDVLIRKYGYRGTPATLAAVDAHPELASNLSASAHLIHGSSEGRFRITYCPGGLTQEEVEGAGFAYGNLDTMTRRYDPSKLRDGWNEVAGEEVFFISNPALGLWGTKERFASSSQ